jgi:hypothetical protein
MTSDTDLLTAILAEADAGSAATEGTPRTPRTTEGTPRTTEGTPRTTEGRIVLTENGIEWSVDPVTGIGTRITPVPGRPTMRRPVATTRQFPKVDAPSDLRTLLASLASDAFASQKLVHLLAGETADRAAALNELARLWPDSGEQHGRIVSAYVGLRRGQT